MTVGEIIPLNRDIELNAGKKTIELKVKNVGDRPCQIGSHFHFFEVNKLLQFDRAAAYGYRLDVPSGNAVRFEPGEEKTVTLCEIGGCRRCFGLNNLTMGIMNKDTLPQAMLRAQLKGFTK